MDREEIDNAAKYFRILDNKSDNLILLSFMMVTILGGIILNLILIKALVLNTRCNGK
jgi:hypothetical protein